MKWKDEHVMDRQKNQIPLVNKNRYEKKKIGSRKEKRPDKNQEDSKFQRNSEMEQSEDEPALIPSKRSRRLPTARGDDLLLIGSNQK